MSGDYQCLNCALLGQCRETSEKRVVDRYVCDRWNPAKPEIVDARNQVILLFGEQGIKSIVSTDLPEKKEDS